MKFFVTGTDTGVGKTAFTAMLARALERKGGEPIALKPVCCGDRGDAHILREACANRLTIDEVNPFWFHEPVAPEVAASESRRFARAADLAAWFGAVAGGHGAVLVEGAGGWLVPSAPGETLADFAALAGLPVLVVVLNRLGCLNHSLLTLESIRARGLPFAGFVLNAGLPPSRDASVSGNLAALERASGERVVVQLRAGQTELDPESLRSLGLEP